MHLLELLVDTSWGCTNNPAAHRLGSHEWLVYNDVAMAELSEAMKGGRRARLMQHVPLSQPFLFEEQQKI